MQYNGEKREKLNKLEKKLYSRSNPDIIDTGRSELSQPIEEKENINIKESWRDVEVGSLDELAYKVSKMAGKKYNFVKKIFIFSLLFFIIAAGVAAFVFWGGMNIVSSRNVDIKIIGPLSVGGGQETSFDINVINNNNTDLDSASLLVEYPKGTRSAVDLSKELDQERFALNKIKSGESYNQTIKAVFFGEESDSKQLKISLEYRVENSSALFYKEKMHEVSISSAPVIITSTYPKEANSNQEISFNVEIASNSKDRISNFLVSLEYPFGFIFKEAFPSASYGGNIWRFSDLNPGEKKTIQIRGNIIGQDNEERIFKINTGIANENDERIIAVPFSQSIESILVKKPFIGLDVLIEGKSNDFASRDNSQITTELLIRNNLPSRLFNVYVEVSFRGGAFNGASVFPRNNGFFQSFNNTILWDKRSVPELSDMAPGSEEGLSFRLSPLSYTSIASGAKPEIEITTTVRGERILESGSAERVIATETRKIILTTDLSLSSKVVRSIGSLENSGPIPPRVNTPTTYTVIWSVSNSFNQVSNAEVRATLPLYVKWTNLHSPASEMFSFNQVTNEVVWNMGSVLPNTGFNSPPKEVHFQLELLPSLSQVGQAPVILNEAFLSGLDKITGLKIKSGFPALTTNFSGDPSFRTGNDKVVE